MHNDSRRRYVFLGCGLGMSEYAVPGKQVPGDRWYKMEPLLRSKESRQIAVSDEDGRILWFDSDELTVVSVGSRTVYQILSENALR